MGALLTCMGERLIDFVPLKVTGQGESLSGAMSTRIRMHAGGSILNVAVGLARLGHHVAFAGKMAEDFFGHHLLLTLKTEGVDTRFVTTAKAQTALAFVAMEDGEPVYSFYGDGTADTLLTVEDLPESLYQESSILHIGLISLLCGMTPATVLATAERLKEKALLSLDPSMRASFIQDEQAYRALLQRLIALSDILKLGYVDLAWLLPRASIEESLQHLSGLGPALVIARLADQTILSRERVLALTELELRMVISFASAAAAPNCTREGANPSHRSEVEHYLQSGSLPAPQRGMTT
jgi:fructokinase